MNLFGQSRNLVQIHSDDSLTLVQIILMQSTAMFWVELWLELEPQLCPSNWVAHSHRGFSTQTRCEYKYEWTQWANVYIIF